MHKTPENMSVAASVNDNSRHHDAPSDVIRHFIPSSSLLLHTPELLRGLNIRRVHPGMQTLARTIILEHKQPRQPVPAAGNEQQRRAVEPRSRYVREVAVRLVRHVLDDDDAPLDEPAIEFLAERVWRHLFA